jgi:hypothetical protein
MLHLSVRNKTYPMRSPEMLLAFLPQLTEFWEMAAQDYKEWNSVLLSTIAIVSPESKKDLPSWSPADFQHAAPMVYRHIEKTFAEIAGWRERFITAAHRVYTR